MWAVGNCGFGHLERGKKKEKKLKEKTKPQTNRQIGRMEPMEKKHNFF